MFIARTGVISLALLTLVGCNTPRTTELLKDEVIEHHVQGRHTEAKHTLNDLYGSRLPGEPAAVGKTADPAGKFGKNMKSYGSSNGAL